MNTEQKTITKETDNHLSETLLTAWLRLSTSINNSRLVSTMSYNESLVGNLLYHNYVQNADAPITASQLCQKTKMLKSQMNRTLNQLEMRGMIYRERSTTDKRKVFIKLKPESWKDFEKQHESILIILNSIIAELGPNSTMDAIQLFEKICDIADNLFQKGEKK